MRKFLHAGAVALVAAVLLIAGAATGAFGQSPADGPTDSEPTVDPVLDQAIATLEPLARDLWPETFAGLYLGEGGVGDSIFIGFTTGAQAKVERLAQGFPRPDLLRPVTFDRSLQQLDAKQQQMSDDRELANSGSLNLAGVPGGAYDLDIDVQRNANVVILEDANPIATAAFKARYGEDVIVQEAPLMEPAACTRSDCRYELRSGLRTDPPGCSTAFTVRKPDGTRQLLSAAHCGNPFGDCRGDDVGANRRHGGELYGEVRDERCFGRSDVEKHGIRDPFVGRPWIFVDADRRAREVSSTGSWEGLAVGATLCKSGVASGMSCGDVISKFFMPSYVPEGNRFIQATFCVEGGDSGSGVYFGDRAHGVVSGRRTLPCGDPDFSSISGHIEYVEESLDVTVVKVP